MPSIRTYKPLSMSSISMLVPDGMPLAVSHAAISAKGSDVLNVCPASVCPLLVTGVKQIACRAYDDVCF